MEQFILRVCEAENKLHDVEISFTLSSLESFTGIFIFCLHPENRKKVSTKQYDLLCASFINNLSATKLCKGHDIWQGYLFWTYFLVICHQLQHVRQACHFDNIKEQFYWVASEMFQAILTFSFVMTNQGHFILNCSQLATIKVKLN